ncbi:unnamed protein product, partial [Arabidopsis halleri]
INFFYHYTKLFFNHISYVIFSRLVRLHLCTCEPEWLNLLIRLLKDSPKLR